MFFLGALAPFFFLRYGDAATIYNNQTESKEQSRNQEDGRSHKKKMFQGRTLGTKKSEAY
jgi:hypothetical protein